MVKKIIHTADWQLHKNDTNRQQSFLHCKQEYIGLLGEEAIKGSTLQVIVGDIYENFNDVSNEAIILLIEFFNDILKYSPVVVVPGNHDYDEKNQTKKNILNTLKTAIPNPDFMLLEKEECYVYENIVFVNYCHYYGSNKPPTFSEFKRNHPDKAFVALYHDPIQNAKTLNHNFNTYSKSLRIFEGCDCVMAGDIHLRQDFSFGESSFVYPGSPYQLSHGETIHNHGAVIWDMQQKPLAFRYVTLPSPFNFINIEIKNRDLGSLKITNK